MPTPPEVLQRDHQSGPYKVHSAALDALEPFNIQELGPAKGQMVSPPSRRRHKSERPELLALRQYRWPSIATVAFEGVIAVPVSTCTTSV